MNEKTEALLEAASKCAEIIKDSSNSRNLEHAENLSIAAKNLTEAAMNIERIVTGTKEAS